VPIGSGYNVIRLEICTSCLEGAISLSQAAVAESDRGRGGSPMFASPDEHTRKVSSICHARAPAGFIRYPDVFNRSDMMSHDDCASAARRRRMPAGRGVSRVNLIDCLATSSDHRTTFATKTYSPSGAQVAPNIIAARAKADLHLPFLGKTVNAF
jgi:hypothetical protein